jgi:hypothetical protein
MDPIGFGFEGYDSTGTVRTFEEGYPVDDSGEIRFTNTSLDGPFRGGVELSSKISTSDLVKSCYMKNTFVYLSGIQDAAGAKCFVEKLEQKIDLSNKKNLMEVAATLFAHFLIAKRVGETSSQQEESKTASLTLTATVNDTDEGTANNQFEYSASDWQYYKTDNFPAYMNDEHYARNPGATASIRFNGTQIKLYTVKEAVGGNIGISVDGGPEQSISNFSSTQGSALTFSSSILPKGNHILKIRVLGTMDLGSSFTITIDKAEIFDTF